MSKRHRSKRLADKSGAQASRPAAPARWRQRLNIVSNEVKQMSDKQMLKIIADRGGKMPPSNKLSKEEQKQVLDYSRSLAQ
jgi:riboflavin biosynthesis pyrimidine reductase